MSRKEGMFVWYKVRQDKHSSDEGYRSHRSQDGRPRQSSGDEEEDSAEAGGDIVNEEQGAV